MGLPNGENPVSNNIQTIAPRQDGQIVSADASIMEVISRAASDPSTDVDKLERLLGVYERITVRQSEVAFNDAMNRAQAAIGPVVARARNKQTQSNYATYASLDKAVRPIYTKNGFSLSFNTEAAPENHVRVTCRVAHSGGHSQAYQVDMPADGKGAKGGDVMTKTHAAGAAMSYGQRYLLKLIFNLAVASDHDGNDASAQRPGAKIGVTPEGSDFWDCSGPGMSAHQARKDGFDDMHERFREEIGSQHSNAEMNAWIDANISDIQRLPRSWRVILRQAVEEQSVEFGPNPGGR